MAETCPLRRAFVTVPALPDGWHPHPRAGSIDVDERTSESAFQGRRLLKAALKIGGRSYLVLDTSNIFT